jgi:hypothetical protein
MTTSLTELRKLAHIAAERLETLRANLEEPLSPSRMLDLRICVSDTITPLAVASELLDDGELELGADKPPAK